MSYKSRNFYTVSDGKEHFSWCKCLQCKRQNKQEDKNCDIISPVDIIDKKNRSKSNG